MPDPGAEARPPRLLESMPRPVLVVFLLAGIAALVASVIVIVRPPEFGTVPLAERRPPPGGVHSHDPVQVFPAPTPTVPIEYRAPCPGVQATRPIGGTAFTRRVTSALTQICTLRGLSVPEEVRAAVRGLDGATIRLADFGRSGIESTVDFSTRTIWVNLRLAASAAGLEELIPVLLHEGYHLAFDDEPITAERELAARRVELEACRLFIRSADWPRACEDAHDLMAKPEEEALALLVSAGYRRGVSS